MRKLQLNAHPATVGCGVWATCYTKNTLKLMPKQLYFTELLLIVLKPKKDFQQPKQVTLFFKFLVLREEPRRKFFGKNLKLTKPLSRLTSTTRKLQIRFNQKLRSFGIGKSQNFWFSTLLKLARAWFNTKRKLSKLHKFIFLYPCNAELSGSF